VAVVTKEAPRVMTNNIAIAQQVQLIKTMRDGKSFKSIKDNVAAVNSTGQTDRQSFPSLQKRLE
jgi:hypothetical protein